MKETSWRTLMLMTTVLILVVIFEATARPYKPKTPLIGPNMGGDLRADCNGLPEDSPTPASASEDPNKPAPSQPTPVVAVTEERPVWLNDNLGDLNGTSWASDDDSDESSSESDDPNESSPPVPK